MLYSHIYTLFSLYLLLLLVIHRQVLIGPIINTLLYMTFVIMISPTDYGIVDEAGDKSFDVIADSTKATRSQYTLAMARWRHGSY